MQDEFNIFEQVEDDELEQAKFEFFSTGESSLYNIPFAADCTPEIADAIYHYDCELGDYWMNDAAECPHSLAVANAKSKVWDVVCDYLDGVAEIVLSEAARERELEMDIIELEISK